MGDKHGWEIQWMEDLKDGVADKVFRSKTCDVKAWRVKHKQQGADDVPSQEYCKMGCGRPCASFSFCCAGCSMGFGHDISCGMVVQALDKAEKLRAKRNSRAAKMRDAVHALRRPT